MGSRGQEGEESGRSCRLRSLRWLTDPPPCAPPFHPQAGQQPTAAAAQTSWVADATTTDPAAPVPAAGTAATAGTAGVPNNGCTPCPAGFYKGEWVSGPARCVACGGGNITNLPTGATECLVRPSLNQPGWPALQPLLVALAALRGCSWCSSSL